MAVQPFKGLNARHVYIYIYIYVVRQLRVNIFLLYAEFLYKIMMYYITEFGNNIFNMLFPVKVIIDMQPRNLIVVTSSIVLLRQLIFKFMYLWLVLKFMTFVFINV